MIIKHFMGRSRKRVVQRSDIPQRFLCFLATRSGIFASYPSTQYFSSGSFGAEHTSAYPVLFFVEGNFYSGTVSSVDSLFFLACQSFDFIINGYCKNRIGNHLIEQGDYQLIAEDNQIIHPLEFADKVVPGMVFEMSIILRQDRVFEDIEAKCPRCYHNNVNASADRGWIDW